MTKKKNKKNNKKKCFPIIITIVAVLLLVSGGTYAYWQWQSTNNTVVNFTVTGAHMNITNVGGIGTSVILYPIVPTEGCYTEKIYTDDEYTGTVVNTIAHTGEYTGKGYFKVEATNMTSTGMNAFLVLKARIETSNKTLRPDQANAFKWAISEVSNTNTDYGYSLCSTASNSGGMHSEGTFYLLTSATNNSWTNVHTGQGNSNSTAMGKTLSNPTGEYLDLNFYVPPKTTVTKYFHLYTWLDDNGASDYTNDINMGETINDATQNLSIEISFADSQIGQILPSRMEQVTS